MVRCAPGNRFRGARVHRKLREDAHVLSRRLSFALLFVVLGAGFVYALAHLFALRFETGDIYPPYSSWRAEPLGTKGLADALAELPNVKVQRNVERIPKLPIRE